MTQVGRYGTSLSLIDSTLVFITQNIFLIFLHCCLPFSRKLNLEEISGSGMIAVKLETFSDFARNTPSRNFVVPQTIYVRASIDSAVPNSFFVQVSVKHKIQFEDKLLNQGGPTAGPRANVGPPSNFFGLRLITGDLHV